MMEKQATEYRIEIKGFGFLTRSAPVNREEADRMLDICKRAGYAAKIVNER